MISTIALLTLFYIATRHDINTGFPNGYAFILCIATAVLLALGENHPKLILTQFLSLKPLVFIGLISYSLYIWHWPILALVRYLGIEETTWILILVFGLILIAAYLSWRYIEKPARNFKKIKFSYSLVSLLILPVLVTHISDYLIKSHEGYPQRFKEASRVYAELNKYASPQRPLCLQEKNIDVNSKCRLGAKNANSKTGFMIGDSYSNHYWGFMDILGQEANLSILAHATAACLSLPGISQYDWNVKVYKACHEQTERYYNMIKANHYDYVIIGQNWNGYLGNKLILKNDNSDMGPHVWNKIKEK
ncbi:hypothetical protein TUM19329_17510 [Legionella antarctica]|uniref:SGNH domain-containing protein n=2 Tax=Legionella antarctica TaxID=2708020 RepID=A0A6F8T5G3_9GAMM|nr:hypothetical protein TUM19329_17510 [Legionella antarctica]